MDRRTKLREKGITLVALVVTIIVLLILAGVTISLLLGDNGVLTQSQNAHYTQTKATIEQEIELSRGYAETYKQTMSGDYLEKVEEYLDNDNILKSISSTANATKVDDYVLLRVGDDFNYKITENAVTFLGNKEEAEEALIPEVIELKSSNVEFSYNPSTPCQGPVEVTITLKDDALALSQKYGDLIVLKYKIGQSGNWQDYTGAFNVSENCVIYPALYNGRDYSQTSSTGDVSNIDKDAPTSVNFTIDTASVTENSIKIEATASDDVGIKYFDVSTDGGATYPSEYRQTIETPTSGTVSKTITLTGLSNSTKYTLKAKATDEAGNSLESETQSIDTYEIVFNANGGQGTMSNQTLTYDQNSNLTANTFTREGYHFKEWNTKSDGTGSSYSDGAQVRNLATMGKFNLYAIWEINVYQVTCEDWYVNSSNTKLNKLGSATRDYEYNTTARGSDFGSNTSNDYYYLNYKYSGNTSATIKSNTTIYRYFNIEHAYKICIVENYEVEQRGVADSLKSKIQKWFPDVTYDASKTEQQLKNLNSDVYIFYSKVWELTKSTYANNLYNSGKNIITCGNDSTSNLSIISSFIKSSSGYTANKKVSNIVTNCIGNSVQEPADDLRLPLFKNGVEKWYTTTAGGTTYDIMGCLTGSSGNKWIHSNLREFPGNSLYYAIVYSKS